jgi:hypothetical protein
MKTENLWGPEYDYWNSAEWRQFRRDRLTRVNVLGDTATRNTGYQGARNCNAAYRPADGRIWYAVGNQRTWQLSNVDGFGDVGQESNGVTVFSFPLSNPYHVTREGGWPTDISKSYGQSINPWKGHDPHNDRFLYVPASGFGTEWDAGPGAVTVSPVAYVNATTARFAGNVTAVPANTKLKFLIDHPQGGANVPLRGRVVSSRDVGGGQIEVVMAWQDPNVTFQSPQAVIIAAPASGHWSPQGAWQEGDVSQITYRENTNKWYVSLNAVNYATGETTRAPFEMPSRTAMICGVSGQVMSPASTGRGHELWLFSNGDGSYLGRYDLVNHRYDVWSVEAESNDRLDSCTANFGCGDEEGNLYLLGPLTNTLHIFNVRGASPRFVAKRAINASQIIPSNHPNTAYCYAMVWNEDIRRIELYAARDNTMGVGRVTIYLLNPATNPVTVEEVGRHDQNGLPVWGAIFCKVPGGGDVPQRTLLMGGIGTVGNGTDVDKLRTFVAGNRRSWQEIAPLPHRQMAFTNRRPLLTEQSNTVITRTGLPHPSFNSITPIVGADGLNTGDFTYMAGGDGDYGGNDVFTCFASQVDAQNRFAAQSNTWDGDVDISVWHKRIRTPYRSGGVYFNEELVGNPSNLAEWQPSSSHWGYVCAYHPTYGLIADALAPDGIGRNWTGAMVPKGRMQSDPVEVPTSYTDNPDLNYWGLSRGNAASSNRGAVSALIGWNRTGANAGKWRRITLSTNQPSYKNLALNPVSGRLIGFRAVGGGGGEVWRMDSSAAAPEWTLARAYAAADVIGNTSSVFVFDDPGSRMTAAEWITGNLYIVRRYLSLVGGQATHQSFLLYDDSGTGTLTNLRGANGNAILNAEATAPRYYMCCPDRENGRMVWLIPRGDTTQHRALDIYTSPFSDLMNWKKLYVKDGDTTLLQFGVAGGDATGPIGLKPGFVANGYLYFTSVVGAGTTAPWSGDMRVWRLPLY